jgi:hypothetical protein
LAQDASLPQVTATRLDGAALIGQLGEWTSDHVAIATPDGQQAVALSQLLSLRWPPTAPPASLEKQAVAELVDGSVLPIDRFRLDGNRATLTLHGLPAQRAEISVGRRQVASVRLLPLSAAAQPQWQEILGFNLPSDVLVLAKRSGQSLDHIEGVLGGVTDDRIEFIVDGEPIRIERTQVAGLVFLRRAPPAEPRGIVHGRSGLRAAVAGVVRAGDSLQLNTAAGVELSWPLADVYLADFSAGKVVYLSDLEPAHSQWTPLVGLPTRAASAALYGRPRRDRSFTGGPLVLWFPVDGAAAGSSQEKHYSKGVALRSRTELAYRLPRGYRRFVAAAGIDPAAGSVGSVALTIRGDERVLLETEIAGDQPPRDIDVDIQGASRLSIVVDYGRNLDTGDWLNLCDARLVK